MLRNVTVHNILNVYMSRFICCLSKYIHDYFGFSSKRISALYKEINQGYFTCGKITNTTYGVMVLQSTIQLRYPCGKNYLVDSQCNVRFYFPRLNIKRPFTMEHLTTFNFALQNLAFTELRWFRRFINDKFCQAF